MARKTLKHRDETLIYTASSSHAAPTHSRKVEETSSREKSVGIPSAKQSHGIKKRDTLMANISPKYVDIRDSPSHAPMLHVTPPSKGRKEGVLALTASQISDALEEETVHEDEQSDRIACDDIEKNVDCVTIPHHAIQTTVPEAVIEIEALAKLLSPAMVRKLLISQKRSNIPREETPLAMAATRSQSAKTNIKTRKRKTGLNSAKGNGDKENSSNGGRTGGTASGISPRANRAKGKRSKVPSKFSA